MKKYLEFFKGDIFSKEFHDFNQSSKAKRYRMYIVTAITTLGVLYSIVDLPNMSAKVAGVSISVAWELLNLMQLYSSFHRTHRS